MTTIPVIIANRTIRLFGNLFKILSYPFHLAFPKARFTIPEYAPPAGAPAPERQITPVIWQTNYTNRVSLPVYLNYLFNRLMSSGYEYRYVSTEARSDYLREHAPAGVYDAYQSLTDGAAQADLWRVFTLYREGGIYMDIDATLVWPLRRQLAGIRDALYITIKNGDEITNYFLATAPGNPQFKAVMDKIVSNIDNYDYETGVYGTTGPKVFNQVLAAADITARRRRHVCIQGAFTNEYFQYIDKPRGKWTHQTPSELIKK